MAIRVRTGCADCKRCTNWGLGEGARKTGRFIVGMGTLGMSGLVTRKCRACGHVMSLHDRADNNPFFRNTNHRGQPVVWAARRSNQQLPPGTRNPLPRRKDGCHPHRLPLPRWALSPSTISRSGSHLHRFSRPRWPPTRDTEQISQSTAKCWY